jgi:hypothetical protein
MSAEVNGEFESTPMNAMSDVHTLNRFSKALEDTEAHRLGIKVSEARVRIANRIGTTPTTLENLRRMRTKIVPNWLMNRVRAELVSVLQSEIQRLEHEVHIAKQIGQDRRDDLLAEAETSLASAREILRGEVR